MRFSYFERKRFLVLRRAPIVVSGSFTSVYQVLNFITLLEYFERSGFEYEAIVKFSSYWGEVDESIFKELSLLYRVKFVSLNEEFEALLPDMGSPRSIVEVKVNSAKMLPWERKVVFTVDEGIGVFRTSVVRMYRSWARECATKNTSPSISLFRYLAFRYIFRIRNSIFGAIRFSMVERRWGRFFVNESFLSCYRSLIKKVSDQYTLDFGCVQGSDKPFFIFLTAPFVLLGILNQCEMASLCKNIEAWCESRGYQLLIKPHPADEFRSQEFHFLRPDVPAEFYFQQLGNVSGVIGYRSTSLITAKVAFRFAVYHLAVDNFTQGDYVDPGIEDVINNYSETISFSV